MAEKVIRMVIPNELYKRYKILCVRKDLSMSKQTSELIKKFTEIQETNDQKLKSKSMEERG